LYVSGRHILNNPNIEAQMTQDLGNGKLARNVSGAVVEAGPGRHHCVVRV
jgi:hypothetical protein